MEMEVVYSYGNIRQGFWKGELVNQTNMVRSPPTLTLSRGHISGRIHVSFPQEFSIVTRMEFKIRSKRRQICIELYNILF